MSDVSSKIKALGFTFIREKQGVAEYRFDSNGLKVVLAESHVAPVVTTMIVYRVGSRNEGVGAADAARSESRRDAPRTSSARARSRGAAAATSPLRVSWIAPAVWSTRRHWRSIASSAAAAPASSSASSREASSSARQAS